MDMITLAMAKNYTDSQRLAYVESETVEILAETTLTVVSLSSGPQPNYFTQTPGVLELPAAGTPVVITIDGVSYDDVVRYTANGYLGIGNFNRGGGAYGEDTGESYSLIMHSRTSAWYFMCDTPGAHTVKVEIPEQVKTIDPKYLPDMGGGLPAVEITTEPTEEGAVLSEAESAELEAALNSANIIANLWLASINLIGPALLMRMEVGDQVGFAGAYAAKALQIVKTDGVWRFAAFGG